MSNPLSSFILALSEARRRLIPSRDDQTGQGMVEYALILVLIAVVVIIVLVVLGNQVANVFNNIVNSLQGH